jgi:RNA polymerase sigma factor (sigma-70 family)
VAQLTDEILMTNVKDGQLSDLAELFERYHVLLYNFFLKLTGDRNASEDLTQNLFYRVLRYRHTYNITNGSFKSWLYQMARNLHADFYKKEKKVAEILRHVDEVPDNVADKPGGFQEDDYEKLRIALGGLGPVDRELIVLSRFEGLKYAEIAKIKESSVGSIKVQIHRAIKELRNLYFKQ